MTVKQAVLYHNKKLATVVEGEPKAPFSIAKHRDAGEGSIIPEK